jgi:hypothetical protein
MTKVSAYIFLSPDTWNLTIGFCLLTPYPVLHALCPMLISPDAW